VAVNTSCEDERDERKKTHADASNGPPFH